MALGPTSWYLEPDVLAVVLEAVKGRQASWNTYIGHGRGFTRDSRAVDFWSPAGRGSPINRRTGSNILKYLFNLDHGPLIRYYIWQGNIWNMWTGVSRYWDSNDMHYDHVHVSYLDI